MIHSSAMRSVHTYFHAPKKINLFQDANTSIVVKLTALNAVDIYFFLHSGNRLMDRKAGRNIHRQSLT
jgi:hypothetical protein